MTQTAPKYLNVFFMNSNNCSDQNVSINVNLSLKSETLRMLVEMANDMGASLEDVISSITEDSVIELMTSSRLAPISFAISINIRKVSLFKERFTLIETF